MALELYRKEISSGSSHAKTPQKLTDFFDIIIIGHTSTSLLSRKLLNVSVRMGGLRINGARHQHHGIWVISLRNSTLLGTVSCWCGSHKYECASSHKQ
jgi:hypothetical protein